MADALDVLNKELERRDGGGSRDALDVIDRAEGRQNEQEAQDTLDTVSGVAKRFGEGFNLGLANVLGAPVDVVNFGLGMAGLPTSETPIGGTESIKQGMDLAGINAQSEGTAGRIGEEVGAGAAFALPVMRAAQGVRAGTTAAGQVSGSAVGRTGQAVRQSGRDIVNTARSAPGRFMAGEAAVSAGAGAGASATQNSKLIQDILRDTGMDEQSARAVSEQIGQIGGGIGAGATLNAGRRFAQTVRQSAEPFTQAGQRREAARRAQASAQSPAGAADEIENAPAQLLDTPLTSAQVSNDPGLQGLERRLTREDPNLGTASRQQRSDINQAARREIEGANAGGQGSIEDARAFFEGRVQSAEDAIRGRVRQAVENAGKQLENMDTGSDPTVFSRVVRDEIEQAYQDARGEESRLWRQVVGEEPIDTSPLREEAEIIRAKQFKSSKPGNVPDNVLKTIEDGFDESESVEELLELRSRVLQDLREARATPAPNRRYISNLDRIQTAVLDTLEQQGGDTATDARRFSKEMHDRFTRGPVGGILATTREGGNKVDPAETLDTLLKSGTEGGIGADAILSAMGGRDAVLDATENYIKQQFVRQVAPDGTVRAKDLQRFLKNNQDAIKRFPKLQNQLSSVAKARQLAETVENAGERNVQRLRKSRAALFLDKDPQVALGEAMSGNNAPQKVQSLVQSARKDPTGRALSGLRQAFLDRLLSRQGIANQAEDMAGEGYLSASKLTRALDDPKFRGAAKRLLGEDGLTRLRRVQDALRKVEAVENARVGRGSDTAENLMQNNRLTVLARLAAQVAGARFGARMAQKTAGGSIQSAGAGSRMFRNVVNKMLAETPEENIEGLLKEAVFDPKVMRTLLQTPTGRNQNVLARRLRGHLANLELNPNREQSSEDRTQQSTQGQPAPARQAR